VSLASIALNRFGLGARSGDAPIDDPRGWLLAQFAWYEPRPIGIAAAPTSVDAGARLASFYDQSRTLRLRPAMGSAPVAPSGVALGTPNAVQNPLMDVRREAGRIARADYTTAVGARLTAALNTDAPFVERMVHFWANHFAVSADKLPLIALAGTLEFEAIRPHVLGRFADMLHAVERHPAMLIYLDQAISVGPGSPVGQRVAARGVRSAGLNENLAREILELHTLGARSGYTQADVTEFAKALTGWTVSGLGRNPGTSRSGEAAGRFVFAPDVHEPGDRVIVGQRYPAAGEEQGGAVLARLAQHPATARHLATKLARHFAGDVPPPAMVARLEAAYLASDGDLPTVYRAIMASPEAWDGKAPKFRTPWEWTVASYRALGINQVQPAAAVGLMNQLGQPVWKPGQPSGYDDVSASWAAPDAVMRRVEAAPPLARRASAVDPRRLGDRLFPGALSPGTARALGGAESRAQALVLLLVSPEMMRR